MKTRARVHDFALQLAIALCSLFGMSVAVAADGGWMSTWSAAPDSAGPALKAQTVRQIARVSVGGKHVRIHLSNLFGQQPVMIGPVHVALHAAGSTIQPGSDHAITFGGQATVTIPKGESVTSDTVAFVVAPLQEVAISLYLPADTGPATQHGLGMQTAYLTEAGDATASAMLPAGEVLSARLFLTDVEVEAGPAAYSIVTLGDSITDGAGSTQDQNRRWPDVLAARLRADPALASIAVSNAGISGNRILNDGTGPSALKRFDRDVLGKPGARWLVLLEGINDIGQAGAPPTPADAVSAEQIIAGMKTLITRAHSKGMKVLGATLTPFGGVDWPYHTAAGETKRQSVNNWIRAGGTFDAVLDFDRVTRDPAHPDHFLAAYDCGDHLHPSDKGYEAMANSINLRLFHLGK